MTVTEECQLHKLYVPEHHKRMDVVVFGSGSGTNLEAILRHAKDEGAPFAVRAIFTDRLCRCCEIAATEEIPLIYHSYKRFVEANSDSGKSVAALRHDYDSEVASLLNDAAAKQGFSVDLIVLAGYMRLISFTLLEAFSDRIINVHPADLTVLNSQGQRRYVGADAVADALKSGETQTRSSVILIDETVDGGPTLVSGPWVDYTEEGPLTREKIKIHQEKQKHQSDWPAVLKAIELIAAGKVAIDEEKNVYVDGIRAGDSGYKL